MPTLSTVCACGSRNLARPAGEGLEITTTDLEEVA